MPTGKNNTGWTIASLKEHYDERFRALENRFDLADKAIIAALEAKDKYSAVVHAASKEAITKAEEAQKQYNSVHNDLVRKNELMQTRGEAEREKQNILERLHLITDEVTEMRLWRSNKEGSSAQTKWIAIAAIIISATIGILSLVLNYSK